MLLLPTLLAVIACLQAAESRPGVSDWIPDWVKNGLTTKYIVGGEEAEPHTQFPYQVAVYNYIGLGMNLCGGSLIAPSWVLTAAHCVKPPGSKIVGMVDVVVGAHNRLSKEDSQQRIRASKVVVNPGWTAVLNEKANDLALIKLKREVDISDKVNIVRLPSASLKDDTLLNKPVVLSGWGQVADKGSASNTLRYVATTVGSNKDCKFEYGAAITDNFICASGAGRKGACKGDSGGPMVMYEEDGKPTIVGVAAFVGRSCTAGRPSAYTRVTPYLDWINDTINSD